MTTQPTNQPPQRSLNDHLSYLREHMHGTTEFKRRATVAMHFAQHPHLYTTSNKPCREYVEGAMRGLHIGAILRFALWSSMEATAWFVAAMTPTAWVCADVLLSQGLDDDFEPRCYEAALMYAWVPVGRLACGRLSEVPARARIRALDGAYFIAERWGCLSRWQDRRHLVVARGDGLQRLMLRYDGGRTFDYGRWDLAAPLRRYRYDGLLFDGPRFEGEHFEVCRYGQSSGQWLAFGCENWLGGVFTLEAER